ncbi:hypothetical protein F5879DRAFT_810854 [Lentinula edodes]|nr:hypothetical protein F5879DRAFT_810854 [Lentinula edodes]
MVPTNDGGYQATLTPAAISVTKKGNRPSHSAKQNCCLCSMVKINSVQTFVLFNSRSTADVLSPDFVPISHRQPFQLENPVTLQLSTKESQSCISYGYIQGKEYFNVTNIHRYNAVLGTMFMRKHGMALDFKNNTIKLHGKQIPTLTEGEENRKIAR